MGVLAHEMFVFLCVGGRSRIGDLFIIFTHSELVDDVCETE